MKIECSNCNCKNEFKSEEKVHCKNCNEDMSSYTYRTLKSLRKYGVAGIMSLGGLLFFIPESRKTIEEEYEIIQTCVTGKSGRNVTKEEYGLIVSYCSCSLKRTLSDIGTDYDTEEFKKSWKIESKKCKY